MEVNYGIGDLYGSSGNNTLQHGKCFGEVNVSMQSIFKVPQGMSLAANAATAAAASAAATADVAVVSCYCSITIFKWS